MAMASAIRSMRIYEVEGSSSATSEFAATNIVAWSLDGSVVENVIQSSQTKFVAEAALSPDGRYLYLLTSAHIQTSSGSG